MSALAALTRAETKVTVREPMAVFWGLAFPAVLLTILALVFPGAREPSDDLGGARLVDLYTPIVLALSIITVAFSMLPATLAQYREHGLLRRLATTPVHPWRMVGAQLLVQGSLAILGAVLALVVGTVGFGVAAPGNPLGFAASFLLATASMFTVGLLIGAMAPTAASGQGIGMAVFFPMMLFSGVYFPREVMPDGLRTVSDLTPAGAAVQAMTDSWAGQAPGTGSLAVMAVYAIVAATLAVRSFRWD